jgi:hypothetical protein
MGIILHVLVPFVVGAELMEAWDERRTDPRILLLRAKKKLERQAANEGISFREYEKEVAKKVADVEERYNKACEELDSLRNAMLLKMSSLKDMIKSEPKPDQEHHPEGQP